MAHPVYWKAILEIVRGDAAAALNSARPLEIFGREHGMAHWRALGEMQSSWGRGRLHDSRAGTARFRQALAAYADHGLEGVRRSITACLLSWRPTPWARTER